MERLFIELVKTSAAVPPLLQCCGKAAAEPRDRDGIPPEKRNFSPNKAAQPQDTIRQHVLESEITMKPAAIKVKLKKFRFITNG